MSDDGRDPFAIPKDMRTMAEQSFEQARKAFDKFMESAKTTAGSMEERRESVRAGAKEIGSKAVSYAEKNVQASLDYAQSLLKAKDLPEVIDRIWGEGAAAWLPDGKSFYYTQLAVPAEGVDPMLNMTTRLHVIGTPIENAIVPGGERGPCRRSRAVGRPQAASGRGLLSTSRP